jgi:hypothetical protein
MAVRDATISAGGWQLRSGVGALSFKARVIMD